MLGYHGQYEHHTSGSQWSDPHQKCLQISCKHETHHHGQQGAKEAHHWNLPHKARKLIEEDRTASGVIKELAKWIKI